MRMFDIIKNFSQKKMAFLNSFDGNGVNNYINLGNYYNGTKTSIGLKVIFYINTVLSNQTLVGQDNIWKIRVGATSSFFFYSNNGLSWTDLIDISSAINRSSLNTVEYNSVDGKVIVNGIVVSTISNKTIPTNTNNFSILSLKGLAEWSTCGFVSMELDNLKYITNSIDKSIEYYVDDIYQGNATINGTVSESQWR